MSTTRKMTLAGIALAAIVMTAGATPANAWGFGFGYSSGYCGPGPVYVAPPVYYPPPVYVAPAPVYYPPVYYPAPAYRVYSYGGYYRPYYRSYGFGFYGHGRRWHH